MVPVSVTLALIYIYEIDRNVRSGQTPGVERFSTYISIYVIPREWWVICIWIRVRLIALCLSYKPIYFSSDLGEVWAIYGLLSEEKSKWRWNSQKSRFSKFSPKNSKFWFFMIFLKFFQMSIDAFHSIQICSRDSEDVFKDLNQVWKTKWTQCRPIQVEIPLPSNPPTIFFDFRRNWPKYAILLSHNIF